MAQITNALGIDLGEYERPVDGRIYIPEKENYTSAELSAMEAELAREDKIQLHPEVRHGEKSILLSDRRKMPKRKAEYDWTTKNTSFLELHEDLKILGVKNNKFFLRLLDPDLKGIDPFIPNLPVELQIKIFFEVWTNPWYFLREICRIPEDGKPIVIGGGSEFKIDRNSVATWFLFLNGIDHYGSKPRQCGKTQDAIAKQLYAFNWGCIATQFLFFNKDFPQAKVNLYRMKCQREMLPSFLHMDYAVDGDGKIDKGTNNVTSMRNPLNGNQIKCMTKATSQDIANSQGRGDTAAMHYMDEFDFWPFNTTIMKASSFAYSKASENAMKNKSLHCRICTSTPGFTSSRDGKAAVDFIDQCVLWQDKYFDEPITRLNSIIHGNKHNGFVYVEHTWKQLKKTEAWYEKQCELVSYDATTIAREIDLKRVTGNEQNPLSKEQQSYISSNTIEPYEQIDYSNNLCPFYIYEKLNRDYPYLMIIDPAEGLGGDHDNNALIVLNPYTQRTVIEYKSPYVSQPGLFELMNKLMLNHIPNAVIIVESNKGRELINIINDSVWKYRLWYDEDKLNAKIVEVAPMYIEAQKEAHLRKSFGFDTTSKSRPKLYRTLKFLAEEDIETLCTKFVAKDVLGLVQKPSGKIEAGTGKDDHDDCIMAKLIGHFVYENASNLEKFGIIKGQREPVDASRPLTEEESLAKLREMLPSLPESVQQLFRQTAVRNPVDDANAYYRNIELQRIAKEAEGAPVTATGPRITTMEQSNALWSSFESGLDARSTNSGKPAGPSPFAPYVPAQAQEDDYGYDSSKPFDINDYL